MNAASAAWKAVRCSYMWHRSKTAGARRKPVRIDRFYLAHPCNGALKGLRLGNAQYCTFPRLAPTRWETRLDANVRIHYALTLQPHTNPPDYTGAHRNTHVSTRPVVLFLAISASEHRAGQLRV